MEKLRSNLTKFFLARAFFFVDFLSKCDYSTLNLMEQDLSDIFLSYRTILEECREPFLSNDGLASCKRLQTKIGISLTLMKQIDFGDIIIQTFMGDLDFFSTVVENFSSFLTINRTYSKEECQEIRASLVQSIVKLIPSTKEFYLNRVGLFFFF